jgi:hypothetical protein
VKNILSDSNLFLTNYMFYVKLFVPTRSKTNAKQQDAQVQHYLHSLYMLHGMALMLANCRQFLQSYRVGKWAILILQPYSPQ